MKFETKFNYGQKVYLIFKDKIRKVEIRKISINFEMDADGKPDIKIKYDAFEYENNWDLTNVPEKTFFATKEELIENLAKEIEEL